MTGRATRRAAAGAALTLGAGLLGVLLFAGCLEEPTLEERWTKLEIVSAAPTSRTEFITGDSTAIAVHARVTFRRIVTGDLVAELRYSDEIREGDVELAATEPKLASAQDVDRILASSVSLGTATVLVTGFDHLIREVDLAFDAVVPPGSEGGLFLILYMGDAEEMETESGVDSLVITPFNSMEAEILAAGVEMP